MSRKQKVDTALERQVEYGACTLGATFREGLCGLCDRSDLSVLFAVPTEFNLRSVEKICNERVIPCG